MKQQFILEYYDGASDKWIVRKAYKSEKGAMNAWRKSKMSGRCKRVVKHSFKNDTLVENKLLTSVG